MNTAELIRRIDKLQHKLDNSLFDDEEESERIYRKIERLKFQLEMERGRETQ